MIGQLSLDFDPPLPELGHAGLPVDPEMAARYDAAGLPVYRPTHAVLSNQAPYREFAASRGPNSK